MSASRDRVETQICARLYKLKNYVNARVGSGAEADDLYGDTVLKILRKVRSGEFKEGLSVDAFMWICAKSVISDYFKTKGVRQRLLVDEYVHRISVVEKSPEREYEISEENKKFMEKARRELNDVCRRILILSLFQSMKHWEIANTLGIPRGTVSGHMFRARRGLGDIHLNKARTRMEMGA